MPTAAPVRVSASVFHRVTLRASDHERSRRFLDVVTAPLGYAAPASGDGRSRWGEFALAQAPGARDVTRRLHLAFLASSRDDVDAFWRAGTGAGHASDGEPGLRPQYSPDYYGAFLLDPDGNSVEAVHHDGRRQGGSGVVDHLWIRVADVEATRRFWRSVIGVLGLRISTVVPGRFHVAGGDQSFGLVQGEPSENVHLAFPVGNRETVDAFRRAASAAGGREHANGGVADPTAISSRPWTSAPDARQPSSSSRTIRDSAADSAAACAAARAARASRPVTATGAPSRAAANDSSSATNDSA
jgi:catechol 2,3-dioxygenase-like lactoylglutathione lyase family enzyme